MRWALRTSAFEVEFAGENADILVAAAGEVDHENVGLVHGGSEMIGFRYGVSAFECRDDAFGTGEGHSGLEGVGVGAGGVGGAAGVVEHGVFGADGGVVETGRDGVGEGDLAGVIL